MCPGDWFFSLDLKDAYFHIQIAPHHGRFLRFAFEGVAYQYTVLPFGLSLAPRTFTRCMDAALSPLRQTRPVGGRATITQILPPQPLSVKVDQACVAALAPWIDPQWMERGIPLGIVCRRKVVSTDASNTGWGALCDGKPAFGHWSKEEGRLHINCLEMLAVCLGLHTFLPDLRGHHVLVRSDSMTVVSDINCQGGLSSKRLFILVERLLEWAQLNLHSLREAHVPGRLNQGADILSRSKVPQKSGCSTHKWFNESGRSSVGQRSTSSPQKTTLIAQLFFRRTGMRWPTNGLTSSFTLSPQSPLIPQVTNTCSQSCLGCSRQPHGPFPWDGTSSLRQTERYGTPSPSCGLCTREPVDVPENVLNTISQARALSTRRLYALKWSVFSTWCTAHSADLISYDISLILSFQQELLDKGHSPSTLKVYVAAIAASHAPLAGQSVGRNNLVVHFLKGSRRLNPPRPITVPTWDLPTVLRALNSLPFEPLQSTDLHSLTLKTALLLDLASVKASVWEICRCSLWAPPA